MNREDFGRDRSIDAVKGLAIIAVVGQHLTNRRFGPTIVAQIEEFGRFLTWAVPAFLFLSGMLRARSSKRPSTLEFIAQSAKRLLLPYLVLATVYALIAQAMQGGGAYSPNPNQPMTLAGKFLAILKGNPYVGEQLYYFPLLFLAAVAHRALTGIGVPTIAVVLAVLVWIAGDAVLTGTWNARKQEPLTLFVAAVFHYSLGFAYGRSPGRSGWAVVAGLLAAGAIAGAALIDWRLYTLAVPLALMMAVERLPERLLPAPIVALGAASATIFAYHSPFVIHTLVAVFHKAGLPPYVNAFTALSLTLAICYALHVAINRSQRLTWLRI